MNKSFFFYIFFITSTVFSQQDKTIKSEQLNIIFNNNSFIKNNEYFNFIADGYTLFGNISNAKFSYSLNDKYFFNLGFETGLNFGENKISYIRPDISLQIKQRKSTFIFGRLITENHHFMPIQLYDYERVLDQRNLEYGIEHRYIGKNFSSDTWIEWEHYIYKKSNKRERLNFGHSSKWTRHLNKQISVSFPFEIFLHHRGGQINLRHTNNNLNNAMVLMNFGLGISPSYNYSNGKISIHYHYFIHHLNTSNTEEFQFMKGKAMFLELSIKYKHFNVSAGYWKSNKFVSAKGDDMYQAYSKKTDIYLDNNDNVVPVFDNYTEPNRKLFQTEISYSKTLLKNRLFLNAGIKSFLQLYQTKINKPIYTAEVKKNHFDYNFFLFINYHLNKKIYNPMK